VDIVDRAEAAADAMEDEDAEDDGVEDEVHLRKQRKTTTYHKLVGRSLHYLVEEQHHSMPQTPSNDTTIGIIVSCVDLTWKMDTHLQHARAIGGSLGIRRNATDRMYNSTLRQDTTHCSRDSTKISFLRGSDR
jgi:hypothetical protein